MSKNSDFNSLDSAQKEFELLLKRYILPILNINTNTYELYSRSIKIRSDNDSLIKIDKCNDYISMRKHANKYDVFFYPTTYDKYSVCDYGNEKSFCFYVTNVYFSEGLLKRATDILKELLKVTEHNFNYSDFRRKNYYGKKDNANETYKLKAWDLAFELGMCNWITGTYDDSIILHKAIAKLVDWSSKTYEGERVPFGIVIDFGCPVETDYEVNFINFLDNDSSAVITDGMASGVLLNRVGCLLSYLTKDVISDVLKRDKIKKKAKESQANHNNKKTRHKIFVPYHLENLASICYGTRVGIFVMDSGEIILVKNQEICFARRGNKWISFDWNSINSNLSVFSTDPDVFIPADKIREIYSTLLDVSFSHTGGCLAIIDEQHIDNEEIINNDDRIDKFFWVMDNRANVNKREEKKRIVENLLFDKNSIGFKTFYETDRILRKEILSLDGSTIITPSGEFICVGSIVQTRGTTISGGGRTAAAKTFAEFGIGIKISEDGYIEAYKRITPQSFKKNNEPDIIFEFK